MDLHFMLPCLLLCLCRPECALEDMEGSEREHRNFARCILEEWPRRDGTKVNLPNKFALPLLAGYNNLIPEEPSIWYSGVIGSEGCETLAECSDIALVRLRWNIRNPSPIRAVQKPHNDTFGYAHKRLCAVCQKRAISSLKEERRNLWAKLRCLNCRHGMF